MRRSISFDRIADTYDDTRGGLERGVRVAADIAHLLDPGAPVLDVGIGTGIVAVNLARAGFDIVGVDLAPAMAARAAGRIGPHVAVADAGTMPFADASFTQATSTWLLHLVADATTVLREVARVLASGSRYVVVMGSKTEPDAISAASRDMFRSLARRAWSGARNPEGLVALAPGAGFTVTEERLGTPFASDESPAEAADLIEARAYSYLWDVDDEAWAAQVQPTIDTLRALGDAPIPRRGVDRIVVLERA